MGLCRFIFTVEIDGSRTVLVDLSNDTIEIIGCQLVVKFVKNFSQRGCGDVSVTLFIILMNKF